MKSPEEINDNEIRIVGASLETPPPKNHNGHKTWLLAGICIVVVLIGIITAFIISTRRAADNDIESVYEQTTVVKRPSHPLRQWLYAHDDVTISGCAIKDTVVNDIGIRIYLPLNATPALEISMRPLDDENVILAFQAADIRADNKKIVGAFVEKGKPIAWGLSKKGYCAIMPVVETQNPKQKTYNMFIGMADNSPLFEEATECGGYFFRQYPLVSEGMPQESELRSQTLRRALCDVEEHICVVETTDRASMHDFAVLLADLDVSNAIYLIGADAMGTVTDLNGERTTLGYLMEKPFKYTNFIYWTR